MPNVLWPDDATFDNSLGRWVLNGTGCKIDRVASPTPHAGAWVMKAHVTPGVFNGSFFAPALQSGYSGGSGGSDSPWAYTAEPGDTITATAWVRSDPANPQAGLYGAILGLHTFGADFGYLDDQYSGVAGNPTPITESGWTELSAVIVIPSDSSVVTPIQINIDFGWWLGDSWSNPMPTGPYDMYISDVSFDGRRFSTPAPLPLDETVTTWTMDTLHHWTDITLFTETESTMVETQDKTGIYCLPEFVAGVNVAGIWIIHKSDYHLSLFALNGYHFFGLDMGIDGFLYAQEFGSATIFRIDASGAFTGWQSQHDATYGPDIYDGSYHPSFCCGKDGHVYSVAYGDGQPSVLKYDGITGDPVEISAMRGAPQFHMNGTDLSEGYRSIQVAKDGTIWAVVDPIPFSPEFGSNEILRCLPGDGSPRFDLELMQMPGAWLWNLTFTDVSNDAKCGIFLDYADHLIVPLTFAAAADANLSTPGLLDWQRGYGTQPNSDYGLFLRVSPAGVVTRIGGGWDDASVGGTPPADHVRDGLVGVSVTAGPRFQNGMSIDRGTLFFIDRESTLRSIWSPPPPNINGICPLPDGTTVLIESSSATRVNSSGHHIQSYPLLGAGTSLFTGCTDVSGTSFWAGGTFTPDLGGRGNLLIQVDVATGNILQEFRDWEPDGAAVVQVATGLSELPALSMATTMVRRSRIIDPNDLNFQGRRGSRVAKENV